jgi:hypothetical protein
MGPTKPIDLACRSHRPPLTWQGVPADPADLAWVPPCPRTWQAGPARMARGSHHTPSMRVPQGTTDYVALRKYWSKSSIQGYSNSRLAPLSKGTPPPRYFLTFVYIQHPYYLKDRSIYLAWAAVATVALFFLTLTPPNGPTAHRLIEST